MAAYQYRPITDWWILARAKLLGGRKYYGAFPGGFLERARILLGVSIYDPVLHICGGLARFYPYAGGFGPNDKTLDLDPEVEPDFLQDARDPYPMRVSEGTIEDVPYIERAPWAAVLADPAYTPADAAHYRVGADKLPSPGVILRHALGVVKPGGRVGILHVYPPTPPKGARFVAAVAVLCGFNNRVRIFSVYQRTACCQETEQPQSKTRSRRKRRVASL